jgi:hypothetical protein
MANYNSQTLAQSTNKQTRACWYINPVDEPYRLPVATEALWMGCMIDRNLNITIGATPKPASGQPKKQETNTLHSLIRRSRSNSKSTTTL